VPCHGKVCGIDLTKRVYEITQLIPDPNVLVKLEPEELAGKLLFVLRKKTSNAGKHHLGNSMREFWITTPGHRHPYESSDHALVELAIAEAWAYLEAQGLLIPSPEDAMHGWLTCVGNSRSLRFKP
jgi:hypothetical protein